MNNKIIGMLYRTFSEIDLDQLLKVFSAIDSEIKIDKIDPETILCTYEGHTVFSIFSDYI